MSNKKSFSSSGWTPLPQRYKAITLVEPQRSLPSLTMIDLPSTVSEVPFGVDAKQFRMDTEDLFLHVHEAVMDGLDSMQTEAIAEERKEYQSTIIPKEIGKWREEAAGRSECQQLSNQQELELRGRKMREKGVRKALQAWFVKQKDLIHYDSTIPDKFLGKEIAHPKEERPVEMPEGSLQLRLAEMVSVAMSAKDHSVLREQSQLIWDEWQKEHEPQLVLYETKVASRPVVWTMKEPLFGMYPKPMRRDFRTGLPVYVTGTKVIYPQEQARSSPSKQEEDQEGVRIYYPTKKRGGDYRDSKQVIRHSWLARPNDDKDWERSYGRPPEGFHVYKMKGKWMIDHWIHGLSYCIPDNPKKVRAYMDYVQGYLQWAQGVGMDWALTFHFDHSKNAQRVKTVLSLVLPHKRFVFLDCEGHGRYGVMELVEVSPVLFSLKYEESAKIKESLYYVKGGAVEKNFLTGRAAVIELDSLIPWEKEPPFLHSPFGGVFQMAMRVIMLKTGSVGSPLFLSQFSDLILESKMGRIPALQLGVFVSDVIDVGTGVTF